jgi:chromosome segregation ATPase
MVQGERDDLREGVEKMEDELVSLQRSNSLLARRKQQWMEVASQTRVVLEENRNLISQCKAQQLTISELRTKHHTKVVELEGELAEVNEVKKSLEYEVEQLMEGQALLFHQISRLTGVSLSHGATSPESVQHVASLLERFVHDQRRQLAAWQEQTACLEREKQVLVGKVEEAKAVTIKLERELGQVQRVVQEGEETVARLRDQLEELHEQEEATQLQLAHALTQVDKAMSERDIYAGVAKRWQAKGEGEATKARDEAQHQLRVQTAQHRSQHRRYKTEIHQLKSLLSQDNSVGEGTRRHLVSERHRHS